MGFNVELQGPENTLSQITKFRSFLRPFYVVKGCFPGRSLYFTIFANPWGDFCRIQNITFFELYKNGTPWGKY